ncbi:MAG: substrate-binding domain-containing protein [Verrucomicrobia bacterium]|nr:substrate-binding domain-containing protein [Verrucomicrobiota bacterium]
MTDAKTTFIAEVESAFLQRWSAISGMRSYHSPEQNLAVISQPQCRGWVGFLADKNNWDLIRACNCPTINFSNRHGSISWAVNVFSDDDEIGRLAVSAFVARGFINFAFVGLEGHGYSRDRCDGFLKALKLKGYSAQVFNFDDKYCENPIRFASYRRDMVRQWLARMPGPTAVLAANDFAAHSFIDLISDLEPERLDSLAVIGVDNTPLSEQHDIKFDRT